MKPFDRMRSRHGSISDTTLMTIKSFSSAAATCIERDMPLLIRVAQAAMRLNTALAQGRLSESYEAQGELNKLLEESLQ